MKLLYACGDSWTEGNEIPPTASQSEKYYNTWPWFLSRVLDIPVCVNDAAGAGSNTRIFRKTTDFIFDWLGKGKDPADLLIVIGWTTPERVELPSNGSYYRITAHSVLGDRDHIDVANQYQKIFTKAYNSEQYTLESLKHMLNLRAICKGVGVKYRDFIAIGSRPYVYKLLAQQKFNLSLENMYPETWNDYAHMHNHPRYPHQHPTIETHKLWAEELAKALL